MPEQFEFTFQEAAVLSVDELMSAATPQLLRVAREDRRIERKAALIRPRELAGYFSMWANTAVDGGIVVVGITNDGKFAGCLSAEMAHLNRLESESCNYCPDSRVECRKIPIVRDVDGQPDFVLLFRVHYHET